MDDLSIEQVQEQAIRDLEKTIEQQSILIDQQSAAIEIEQNLNKFIREREQTLIAVIDTYRQSRWPWTRRIAEKIHEDVKQALLAHIRQTNRR